MKYEWDDIKYETNLRKHGIRFELAQVVFSDYSAIEMFDEEHSTPDENRFIRIGNSGIGILYVVFCERLSINGEEVTRIISARNANANEVKKYYEI